MNFALIQLNQCSQEILCKLIGATQTTCVFLSSFSILLIAVSILRYNPLSPFIVPILTKENDSKLQCGLKKDKKMTKVYTLSHLISTCRWIGTWSSSTLTLPRFQKFRLKPYEWTGNKQSNWIYCRQDLCSFINLNWLINRELHICTLKQEKTNNSKPKWDLIQFVRSFINIS